MPGDPSLLAPQWDPGPPQCPLRKRLLQQQTSVYAVLSRADFATPLSPALWDIISLLLLGWEPPATLSDISDNATSVLSALLLPECPKPAFTNLEGKITIIKTVSLSISLFCPPHLLLLHPMTLLCDLLLSPLSSADLPTVGPQGHGIVLAPRHCHQNRAGGVGRDRTPWRVDTGKNILERWDGRMALQETKKGGTAVV